jgi:tRNA U34 5-carboxymethylaminomethyl modifying enzyme MnmG/GidA
MREEMVRDGSLAQFRLQVREDKCIAKLLESAKVTEVEPQKETKKAEKTATITAKKTAKKTTKKAATAEEKRSQTRKTTAQKRKPKGKNTR